MRWMKNLGYIALFLIVQCTGPAMNARGSRIVHVKVVADPAIASSPEWQASIANLFENASRVFRSSAGVMFKIDTMYVWDVEKAPSYGDMLLGDCLVKELPKGTSDIVVYFSTSGSPPSLIAAMTLYELGYAYIQQITPSAAAGEDMRTYHSLIHWLAHMFGAVHCYLNKENVTVMNPFVHDGIVVGGGEKGERSEPKFHKGNLAIINALSRRPFGEKEWNAGYWPSIKKAYERTRRTYNPWKIGDDGEIAGYQSDAFHEGNMMLYLSSWAALCGKYGEASLYLDSLDLVVNAIQKICVRQGIVGRTRLCAVCGFDDTTTSAWLDLQQFHIRMRRALIDLRAGDVPAADSCFDAAIKRLPPSLVSVNNQYANAYRFYRDRYTDRARGLR
jgi:hypothetical protein